EGSDTLLAAKQAMRRAPLRGLHYGLLAQLGTAEEQEAVRALPRAQIGFNYLGRIELERQGRFALASESVGRFVADDSPLAYRLEVNASIREGALRVRFSSDPTCLDAAAQRELALRFEAELRGLVERLAQAAPCLLASDFPLARLTQEALASLQLMA